MLFSCKITNAILSDLERRGEDLSPFYDPSFPPMENLRDPAAWMSAPEMESFLGSLAGMNWAKVEGSIFHEAGHAGPVNHAWGVLDSVLRMMPRPQEILHQPDRFLSYFISPEPPIENLQRDPASVSFDLPLPAEQYPNVTAYLRAALEALPLYTGGSLARCDWTNIHLRLEWPETQSSMFKADPGHQVSPELLKAVIEDHQRLLRELEEKNGELQRRDEEIKNLRRESRRGNEPVSESALDERVNQAALSDHALAQNLSRLHDYMFRAQQLVSVLASMATKESGVKEVVRRLDWDRVKRQYPQVMNECFEALRRGNARSNPPSRPKELPHV